METGLEEGMKIVVLDGYTINHGDLSWDGIRKFGETVIYDRTPLEETAERIKDADIVIVNKAKLTREALQSAKNLKFITLLATGYDCVDQEAAEKFGIKVSNVPTYGTDTVAQYTLALILELAHQIGRHSASVKAGEWISSPDWTYQLTPQIELKNKTLGIIGYGRIGHRVKELAEAFGMKVITLQRPGRELDIPGVSQEELFKTSDFVTLHSPLTPITRGIVNKKSLALMKRSAFLINASRGPLIVDEDLRAALDQGIIAGAALDVIAEEPMPENYILKDARNIIITPHNAWSAFEARKRIMEMTEENIQSYLDGSPKNRVI